MPSLIVTAHNQELLEGGKVGYGTSTVWTRYGASTTYEVRLSAKAASMVEDGDTIEWWRGQNYGPVQDCAGQIIKPDNRRIQLTGSADLGIHTGHPPHLGLKMKQACKLVWEYDSKLGYSQLLVEHLPTKERFVLDGKCFPSTIEEARTKYTSFKVPKLNLGKNQMYVFKSIGKPLYEFQQLHCSVVKKTIALVDTDQPVIL